LANDVGKEFEHRYYGSPVVLLNIQQLQSAVYRARNKAFSDWESQIRQFPLAFCDPSEANPKLFFRFMLDIVQDGQIQKIVGWAHPDLLFLQRCGRSALFIDGTFRIVPQGFYQLLIIMIHSRAHNVFVPVWFVLLPNKTEDIYHNALQTIISASNWKLEASTVTCDFEAGLLAACRTHFCGETQSPPAQMVACLFHFKQALRRKMGDLGISQQLIVEFCHKNGPFDLLSVIPPDEIVSKGIPYIRSQFNTGKYASDFDRFWKYFEKQWIKTVSPLTWNVHHLIHDPYQRELLINRTNNPLERFNRKLNDHFPSAHPSMAMFVETLATISNEYVQLLGNIAQGRQTPPPDYVVYVPEVPDTYSSFTPAK
jgi:hypothetical protein